MKNLEKYGIDHNQRSVQQTYATVLTTFLVSFEQIFFRIPTHLHWHRYPSPDIPMAGYSLRRIFPAKGINGEGHFLRSEYFNFTSVSKALDGTNPSHKPFCSRWYRYFDKKYVVKDS